MRKTFFATAILVLFSMFGLNTNTVAQDDSPISLGADVVSRYIWRGINLGGASPHVQPYLSVGLADGMLEIGAWGSHSIGANSGGNEADLYLTVTPVDFVSLTVTDYYFPADAGFSRDTYFNYTDSTTGHTLEGMVCFDFSAISSLPLSLTYAMNFYGADGTDENGDNYLAKYLELAYSGDVKGVGLDAFLGVALDDPAEEKGAIGWYGNSMGVINLGVSASKEIKITDSYSLPISSTVIFNPEAEIFHMVFGISF